jgi:hypothetical protein
VALKVAVVPDPAAAAAAAAASTSGNQLEMFMLRPTWGGDVGYLSLPAFLKLLSFSLSLQKQSGLLTSIIRLFFTG